MLLAFILALTAAVGVAGPAKADWPDRPIKIVVPFTAGSSSDIIARIVAAKMGGRLGQQVVIDNRVGGSTIIGTDAVAKAAPDGYTFCGCSIGPLTIPSTEKLPYDPLADLVPVSLLNTNPLILLVNPNVKANNVKEQIGRAHV